MGGCALKGPDGKSLNYHNRSKFTDTTSQKLANQDREIFYSFAKKMGFTVVVNHLKTMHWVIRAHCVIIMKAAVLGTVIIMCANNTWSPINIRFVFKYPTLDSDTRFRPSSNVRWIEVCVY